MNIIDMRLVTTMPEVPDEIFALAAEEPDSSYGERCAELWQEVMDEVRDTTYGKRAHHNVGTYDQGCRGPLCRKALREHPRRRRSGEVSTLMLREERIYDPVLEYFHIVMKHRVRTAQQNILKELRGEIA